MQRRLIYFAILVTLSACTQPVSWTLCGCEASNSKGIPDGPDNW